MVRKPSIVPGLLLAALLAGPAVLSGCSWVTVSDIPDPFQVGLEYGKVVEEIRIEGNKTTHRSVFSDAMITQVGDVYTEQLSHQDRRWLYQLGIFTSISFDTEPKDDGIVLVVSVVEVSPYIPAPSFAITEENGLEIGLSLSSANFLGTASRLSAYARGGGATNLGARYLDPLYPRPMWPKGLTIDYYHMERFNKVFEFDESTDDLSVLYVRAFKKWLRVGPKFRYLSVGSDEEGITLDPDNRDNLVGFGISGQVDLRNQPVYPTKGWWTELLVGAWGDDANYWQGLWDVRHYREIKGPKSSLALYSLVTLTSGEVGVDVPVYQQFAIGGANTVRGWDLAARVGKNQYLATIEWWNVIGKMKQVEFWFIKLGLGLQLAGIVDVGTAWNASEEFHQNWIAGGGVGIRLLTAAGMALRVDAAMGDPKGHLQIHFGSKEKAIAQRDRVR